MTYSTLPEAAQADPLILLALLSSLGNVACSEKLAELGHRASEAAVRRWRRAHKDMLGPHGFEWTDDRAILRGLAASLE